MFFDPEKSQFWYVMQIFQLHIVYLFGPVQKRVFCLIRCCSTLFYIRGFLDICFINDGLLWVSIQSNFQSNLVLYDIFENIRYKMKIQKKKKNVYLNNRSINHSIQQNIPYSKIIYIFLLLCFYNRNVYIHGLLLELNQTRLPIIYLNLNGTIKIFN